MKLNKCVGAAVLAMAFLPVIGCGQEKSSGKESGYSKEYRVDKTDNDDKTDESTLGKTGGGFIIIDPLNTPLSPFGNDGESESEKTGNSEDGNNSESARTEGENGEFGVLNEAETLNIYHEILESAYNILVTGNDGTKEGEKGISESRAGKKSEEMLSRIGYYLMNLDGNDYAELIIYESSSTFGAADRILSLYTIDENLRPVLLMEGWSGNKCYLLGDRRIYSETIVGSKVITIYSLDGTVLNAQPDDAESVNRRVLAGVCFKDFEN